MGAGGVGGVCKRSCDKDRLRGRGVSRGFVFLSFFFPLLVPFPFFSERDIIFLLAGVTGDSAYIITNLLDREAISRKQTGQTVGPLSRPDGGENSPWRSVIAERLQRGVRGCGAENETHCCGVTPIQYFGKGRGWGGGGLVNGVLAHYFSAVSGYRRKVAEAIRRRWKELFT